MCSFSGFLLVPIELTHSLLIWQSRLYLLLLSAETFPPSLPNHVYAPVIMWQTMGLKLLGSISHNALHPRLMFDLISSGGRIYETHQIRRGNWSSPPAKKCPQRKDVEDQKGGEEEEGGRWFGPKTLMVLSALVTQNSAQRCPRLCELSQQARSQDLWHIILRPSLYKGWMFVA